MLTMAYVANSEKGGIDCFKLEQSSGKLFHAGKALDGRGVTPLTASPDGKRLYAAIRTGGIEAASFAVDSQSGELHFMNAVPVPAALTYMTVDATGRFLLFASYGGDIVGALPIGPGGMLQAEPACLLRPGRNPHCIRLDSSNRHAYVPLLGNDQLAQFLFDADTGTLSPNSPPAVATPRESGPRHIALSPDERFVYLLTELTGEVFSYARDRRSGRLEPMHSVPMLPKDRMPGPSTYTPPTNAGLDRDAPVPVAWAAEIRVTPDNALLFASERTGSTLSCFKVDPVSGRLDPARVVATEERPRGFSIDMFGRYLVAAGEKSNHVSVYAIDREAGSLSPTDRKAVGEKPTWVEIVTLH